MERDAYFVLGKTHTVCQDYATVTPAGVLVCDGCSSSPHTDVGARLLAWSVGYGFGIHDILNGARTAHARLFEHPQVECLDSTLLQATEEDGGDIVKVQVWGDGVLLARDRRGGFWCWDIEYPSGAPLYPSYLLSHRRLQGYVREFGDLRRVHLGIHCDGHSWTRSWEGTSLAGHDIQPVTLRLPARKFDVVLLCSDGVKSFRRPLPGPGRAYEPVPLAEVAQHLLAIKSTTGAFVTRRVRRFLEDVGKQGWHHDDDLAVAGVFFGAAPNFFGAAP